MKHFLILIIICFSQNIFSQIADTDINPNNLNNEKQIIEDNNVYSTTNTDVKPEFPGGINAFYKFIATNYKSPQKNLKGKIYVSFVVGKDGVLENIRILRDIGFETGKEAIRVLKECPKWSPGIKQGKAVRVMYSLPIELN